MQWVGIDKVKKADGTTLEMGDALVALSTGTILDGSVTNAKLSSTAVTESKTVPGTFTTASLSGSAGIVGSQIANTTITATQIANATITHTQIAAAAAITGSQLSATAAIAGSQLAAAAAIAGTQIAANTIAEGNITAKTITHASLSDTAGVFRFTTRRRNGSFDTNYCYVERRCNTGNRDVTRRRGSITSTCSMYHTV